MRARLVRIGIYGLTELCMASVPITTGIAEIVIREGDDEPIIRECFYDHARRQVCLVVEHESFEDIPDGTPFLSGHVEITKHFIQPVGDTMHVTKTEFEEFKAEVAEKFHVLSGGHYPPRDKGYPEPTSAELTEGNRKDSGNQEE